MSASRPRIRDWNDAAAYVRRINSVALPDLGDEDWHRFAQRTFRQGADGPELDYDPAITVPLGKPPSKLSLWLAGLLFRRLARKRPTLLIRGALSDIISADIADTDAAHGAAAAAGRRARRRPRADADRAGSG